MAVSSLFLFDGRASATPAAPVITFPSNGAVITVTFVTVEGTADPGARITVSVSSGGSLSTTANGTGHWSIGRTFTDMTHTLTAVGRDASGNASDPSAPVTFSVDTQTPPAPRISFPAAGSRTNQLTIEVGGFAEPGSAVDVFEGATVASVTAYGDGTFRANVSFAPGAHTITARATDSAGHVSTASDAVTFTIDTDPPAEPVILTPAEGALVAPSAAVVSGTAEPFSTVDVYRGVTIVAITNAGHDGSWSTRLNIPNGYTHVSARVRDTAGNIGPIGPTRNFIVDGGAPNVTFTTADGAIFLPGAPATLEGIAGDDWALQTVTLDFYDITGRAAATMLANCLCVGATSASWQVVPQLLPGRYIVKAYAFDQVGNKSAFATISVIMAAI